MNTYEVSESKLLGISVLLIDALKGFLTVYTLKLIFPDEFIFPAIALTAAVFAHCYSPWLKFKGGRGLATAAGGSAYLAPPILILWILLWTIGFLFRKDVHVGNIMATILSIAVVMTSSATNELEFILPVSLMLFIIFIKHWKPLLEYIGKLKQKNKVFENE